MARVYVSIGTNLNRQNNIHSAVAELSARYCNLDISTVFASAPVGFDGHEFYNLVVGFDTDDDPHTLYRTLRAIEDQHGRDRRSPKFSSRSLDLDLLLYDDLVIQDNGLSLPRDEIEQYAFVLRPLAELAPRRLHPVLGIDYASMWRAFDQTTQPLTPVSMNLMSMTSELISLPKSVRHQRR